MTISLPIKAFLGGLAIIVSLASAAQAGRPLIHSESACKAIQKYYGKTYGGPLTWGGTGNYNTKGCYYYENGKYGGKVYYGTGGVLWTQNANTGDGQQSNGQRRFDALCHKNTTYRRKYQLGNVIKVELYEYPRRVSRERRYGEANRSKLGLADSSIKCDCSNKEMVQGSLGNVSGKCTTYPDGSG